MLIISCAVQSSLSVGTRANTVKAFQILAPRTPWSAIGVVGVIAAFSILAFYTVVGGWTMDYLFRSIIHLFSKPDISSLESQFTTMVTSPVRPIVWTVVFVLFSAFIVMCGIRKLKMYMMPFLF